MLNKTSSTQSENKAVILSSIVEFHQNHNMWPRNKDLTNILSLTKGAISNHCVELAAAGLVKKENNRFRLVDQVLLDHYKHHFDPYFTREGALEPYENKVKLLNDIRTYTQDRIPEIFPIDHHGRKILELLINSLLSVRKDLHVNNLREVFLKADRMIRSKAEQTAEQVIDETIREQNYDRVQWILQLAACMDHFHPELPSIMEDEDHDRESVDVDPEESDRILMALKKTGVLDEAKNYDPTSDVNVSI